MKRVVMEVTGAVETHSGEDVSIKVEAFGGTRCHVICEGSSAPDGVYIAHLTLSPRAARALAAALTNVAEECER